MVNSFSLFLSKVVPPLFFLRFLGNVCVYVFFFFRSRLSFYSIIAYL